MAGDWIKMRVALSKHPKVIAIADALAEDRSFMDWLTDPVKKSCKHNAYEHVTRSVTVSVTVCALMQVWGVANDLGRADGDDLLLTHSTLWTLDEIAGVPGFGQAMASVGWATEEDEIGVRFCNFLLYNIPSEDRKRHQANARQKAKRERDKSVTGSVTNPQNSHARSEQSRAEKSIKTPEQRKAGVFSKLTAEHLADPGRMLEWFSYAAGLPNPVVSDSESSRMNVLCAAERALEFGTKPVALFTTLVSKGKWDFITQAQEDRALAKLREYQQSRAPPPAAADNPILGAIVPKAPNGV